MGIIDWFVTFLGYLVGIAPFIKGAKLYLLGATLVAICWSKVICSFWWIPIIRKLPIRMNVINIA